MEPSKIALVVIGFMIFWGISMYLIMRSRVQEIRDNWENYRCRSWVIPIAKMLNPCVDPIENANQCRKEMMTKIVDSAVSPLNGVFDTIMGSVQSLVDAADMQALFSGGSSNFLLGFINEFLAKLGGVGDVIRYMLIKLRAILNKMLGIIQVAYNIVVGIGMSLVWIWEVPRMMFIIFIVALCIITILICFWVSPYCAFVMKLAASAGVLGMIFGGGGGNGQINYCFGPDTQVLMRDGSQKPISKIQIGDQVANGGNVTETMIFDSRNQKMYRYQNVVVSGGHVIWYPPTSEWREVRHIPEAERIRYNPEDGGSPLIYCLCTKLHQFHVSNGERGFICRDYHGMSWDDGIIEKWYDGSTRVVLQDGSLKTLAEMSIGDLLASDIKHASNPVEGIIKSYQDNGKGDLHQQLKYQLMTSTHKFKIISSDGKNDHITINDYLQGVTVEEDKITDQLILDILNSGNARQK